MTYPIHLMIRMTAALAVFACLMSSEADAGTRNCTPAERAAGNAQLIALGTDETKRAAALASHLPFGVHRTAHASDNGSKNEKLLVQAGFITLHDGDLRTAIWTAHRITRREIRAGAGKDRVNCFRKDPRLAADHAARPVDFDEPIFDQGHMTNDRDLKDDVIEQVNTYVMSNMSAQYCRFNRGIWLSLEHLGRAWAERYGTIYITNGALFDFNKRDARDKDRSAGRIGSRNGKARVAIPSHYFKNFIRKDGERWRSITFLLENHNGPRGVSWAAIKPQAIQSITTLSVIERRAEVFLHPDLPRDLVGEATRQDANGWNLSVAKDNIEGGC